MSDTSCPRVLKTALWFTEFMNPRVIGIVSAELPSGKTVAWVGTGDGNDADADVQKIMDGGAKLPAEWIELLNKQMSPRSTIHLCVVIDGKLQHLYMSPVPLSAETFDREAIAIMSSNDSIKVSAKRNMLCHILRTAGAEVTFD